MIVIKKLQANKGNNTQFIDSNSMQLHLTVDKEMEENYG